MNSDGDGREADRGGAHLLRAESAAQKTGAGIDAGAVRGGVRPVFSDGPAVFLAGPRFCTQTRGDHRPFAGRVRPAF